MYQSVEAFQEALRRPGEPSIAMPFTGLEDDNPDAVEI